MKELNFCSIGHTSCGRFIEYDINASLDEYEVINLFPRYLNGDNIRITEYISANNDNKRWAEIFASIRNKLIVVYLPPHQDYQYMDGNRGPQYYSNYQILPFLECSLLENFVGKEVVCETRYESIKNLYLWLKDVFYFQVYLNQDTYSPLFYTKNKINKLGGIYRDHTNNNVYLLLPYVNGDVFRYNEDRYQGLLSDIYNDLFAPSELEQPEWVKNNPIFLSNLEKEEQNKISESQRKIEEAQHLIEMSQKIIHKEQNLKYLLYGQSNLLENAIHEALKIIGFSNPHSCTTSTEEIDVICDEIDMNNNLLIGEAEGASKGTVNSKKINQLVTHAANYVVEKDINIDSLSISHVLFGNAYIAIPPEQREEYFGQHVYKIAQLHKIKLVRTPDLFKVALYIKNTNDQSFAKKCYNAFFENTAGILEFPPTPE